MKKPGVMAGLVFIGYPDTQYKNRQSYAIFDLSAIFSDPARFQCGLWEFCGVRCFSLVLCGTLFAAARLISA